MLDAPVRVALLARPGEARDQLRRALAELGAQLVAEGDPAELDPGTVAGEKPTVVLVSLEPAVEESLERFDDLLAAPGIEVMYDDAEVTRQLDGWDLARWARHLAAKLVGSDLLPPAPGGADHLPEFDLSPQPGAPPTPAQEMDHARLEDYAAESLDLSEWVPSTPSLAAEPVPVASLPAEPEAEPEAESLDLDLGDLEQAMGRLDAQVQAGSRQPEHDEVHLEFDPDNLDIDLSALPEEGAAMMTLNEADDLALDASEPLLADLALDEGPIKFSNFSDDELPMAEGLDDDVAALAAQLDAFEAQDQRQGARQPDFGDAPKPAAPVPAATPAAAPAPARTAAAAGSGFGALELVPMDQDGPSIPEPEIDFAPSAPAAVAPADRRNDHLSLAEEGATSNNATAPGALLVLAGLGGPDAVRQLLAALPPTLPVPVLLYQHLDTGKHDRLVGQLAKASRLPLDLATEGKLAFPGRVAVLQPGIGVTLSGNHFDFNRIEHLSQVVSALPASVSVVLVLSGADPTVVPAILALRSAGATVLAQDPASCFDAVAAEQVINAGASSASPPELAAQVVACWN